MLSAHYTHVVQTTCYTYNMLYTKLVMHTTCHAHDTLRYVPSRKRKSDF